MTTLLRITAGMTLALAVGCSPGPAALSGSVSLNGKPVALGVVTALGADNTPRAARIQTDGRYSITDLPPGPVRLAVESVDPATETQIQPGEPGAVEQPAAEVTPWFPLPGNYANLETSPLQTELRSGENTFDLKLRGE